MSASQKTITHSMSQSGPVVTSASMQAGSETPKGSGESAKASAVPAKDERDLDDFFAPPTKDTQKTESISENNNPQSSKSDFEKFLSCELQVTEMIPCDLRVDANFRCPLNGGSYKEFKIGQIIKKGSMAISRVASFSRFGTPFTVIHPDTKMDHCKFSSLTKYTAR